MSDTDSEVEFIKEKKMKTSDLEDSERGGNDEWKSSGDEIDRKDAKTNDDVDNRTVVKKAGRGLGMRVAKKCKPAKGYKTELKKKGLFFSDGEHSEGDTSDRSSGMSTKKNPLHMGGARRLRKPEDNNPYSWWMYGLDVMEIGASDIIDGIRHQRKAVTLMQKEHENLSGVTDN